MFLTSDHEKGAWRLCEDGSELYQTNGQPEVGVLYQESANFSCKQTDSNIFGFAGHLVSVVTTQLCCCSGTVS